MAETVSLDRELFLAYLQQQSEAGALSVLCGRLMGEILRDNPNNEQLNLLNWRINEWTDKLTEASETLFMAKR